MSDSDTLYQQRPPAVLTIGTPPSPEKRLCRYGDALCPCQDGDMCHYEGPDPWPAPQQSPIVMIRPAGPHASELYVRTSGGEVITVPLSYGILVNLLEDATAGLRRCEETR